MSTTLIQRINLIGVLCVDIWVADRRKTPPAMLTLPDGTQEVAQMEFKV